MHVHEGLRLADAVSHQDTRTEEAGNVLNTGSLSSQSC